MIKDIRVFPAVTSTGKNTLKVVVFTNDYHFSTTIPLGITRGEKEPVFMNYPDALEVLKKIKSNFIGLDETDWISIDQMIEELDNTDNFSVIGANLALGISISVAKASTLNELWRISGPKKIYRFPYPMISIIGGGKHGGYTTWQEFLVIPYRARDPLGALRTLQEVYDIVGDELRRRKWLIGKNYDNAWISSLDDLKTLDLLYSLAEDYDLKIGVDFAASTFYNKGLYIYKSLGKSLSPEKQLDAIEHIAEVYNLYYLEDPFHQNDFDSFAKLNARLERGLLVGDDLYSSDMQKVIKGIYSKASNAVYLHPTHLGTLYKTMKVARLLRKNGMHIITGHRCGETEDDFISDLSIVFSSPLIKLSYLDQDISKYNRIIQIWEEAHEKEMATLP